MVFNTLKADDASSWKDAIGIGGRSFTQIEESSGDKKFAKAFNAIIKKGDIDNFDAISEALKQTGLSADQVSQSMLSAAENSNGASISIKAVGKAAKASSVGMKLLAAAGNMLATLAISMAITGLIKGIELIATTRQRATEAAQEAQESYKKEASTLESLNTQLEDTQALMNDLEGRELTLVEEDEYNRLKDTNKELKREIELKKERTRIAEKEARAKAVADDKYNTGNGFFAESYSNPTLVSAALQTAEFDATKYGTTNVALEQMPGSYFQGSDYFRLNSDMMAVFKKQQLDAEAKYLAAYDKAMASDGKIDESELKNLETLKEESNKVQEMYDAAFAVVSDRIKEIDTLIGDLSRVENASTPTDIAFNALFDERDALKEAQNATLDTSAKFVSNTVLQKYAEDAEKIKKIVQSVGEITAEQLSSKFGNVVEEFEKFGWSIDDVVRHLNEIYTLGGKPITALSTINAKLVENSTSYTKLNEAIAEFNESGVLSIETYAALVEQNAEYAELLTLTAEGYVFNTEALHEYIEAQNELAKGEALLAAERLQEQLESLADTEENAAERASLERQIQEMYAMAEATENATSALQEFRIAQSTPNKGEGHGTGKEAGEVITEALTETGKVGTDEFEKAMNFMVGEGWESDKDASYKKAQENIKRYFGKDDKTNVKNFAKDLEGAGFGSFDGEVFTMDEVVNIEEAANALGLTEEATESLFKLMQDHGADLTWDFGDLSEEEKALVETTKALEENNQKLSEKKEYQTELQKLEDEGVETVTLDDGSVVSVKDELANVEQEIEETEAAGETLKETLNDLKVDPEKMTPEELVAKIQEVYDAISTFAENGIPVDLSLGATYDSLVAFLQTEHGITVNVNDDGSITFTKTQLESEIPKEKPVDVNVDDNGTTSDVGSAIEGVANGPEGGYQSSIGVKANADDLITTDEQLNSVAEKKRTADIKVQYVDSNGNVIESPSSGNVVNTATEYSTPGGASGTIDYSGAIEKGNALISAAQTSGIDGINSQITALQIASVSLFDAFNSFEAIAGLGFNPETDTEAYNEAMAFLGEAYQSYLDAYNELNTAVSDGAPSTEAKDSNFLDEILGGSANAEEGTAYMGIEINDSDIGEATEIVQSEFDENPIDTSVEVDSGNIQEELEQVASEDTQTTIQAQVEGLSPEEIQAKIDAGELTIDAGLNTTSAQSQNASLQASIETQADKPVGLDTSTADSQHSSLMSKLKQSVTKTVKIVYSGIRNSFATGTKNAPGGLSLVDDGTGSNAGPELIVHNKQGTYELGSGDSPRVTHLDKGDTVYTAKQTKAILAKAAKVGGFFRDGLNNARTIIGKAFATGVSGSMNFGLINSILSGGGSSKKNSSSSSKSSARKWKDYVEKLFDWIEIRLERLQTQTDKWILAASEAIGYISKNSELDKALSSTSRQIEETTQAYQRYMEQADEIAQRSQLTTDIVQRIKDGTIDIASYDDKTKEKIDAYTEWYNKSMACVEALAELREQERDLATQKLDSILDHYQWRIDRLDAVVSSNDAMLGLKAATGIRIKESDYADSIDATTKKIQELTASRAALAKEFADMIDRGYIVEGSELWYEYTGELENLDETIIDTKTDLQDLVDSANKITLTNLQYALTALEASANTIHDMMSLHEAQGIDASDGDYKSLVENGMAQIKNLEAQNAELLKQQAVLEPLSEKYQELQEQIDGNNQSILDLKTSQEQWNDAVIDLKIGELEKYKEQLSKTNDEYQRQKELQQAIEDLERARSQRTQRVFRDGVGFVFEADQDAVLDAQRNLEDVIQNQLLGKLDDLIEALDDTKADTNVYDAFGVLLGKEYSLPDIGNYSELLSNFSKNTDIVTSAMEDAKKAAYKQVLKGVTNQNSQMSFQIGDIVIQNAKGPEDLANAILDNFPNAILQAMHSKT